MSDVAITGATGYLGSALSVALLAGGHAGVAHFIYVSVAQPPPAHTTRVVDVPQIRAA